MGCIWSQDGVTINAQYYKVKERLGEGGFSFVDLVEHSSTGEQYALKRVLCHSKEDEKRYWEEVKYMKLFSHPNIISHCGSVIIPVQEGVSTSLISRILILMPLYRGGTIQDIIDRNDYMPYDTLLSALVDISQALNVMHSMNPSLAHRDIKPANVLIGDDGSVVLMDLGSMAKANMTPENSREAQTIQDDAAEKCTMPYRAPELFTVQTGDNITAATDIWSLGCLIYACFYLQSPFDEIYAKGGSIALAAVGGNIQYPEHNSPYTEDLMNLMKSMLVVESTGRPNIKTILDKLDQMIHRAENRI